MDLPLLRRIVNGLFLPSGFFQRRAEDLFTLDGQNPLLLQRPDDRQGDIELLRHQLIFQQMVIQKGRHQPGPGFLVLLQIVVELPFSGLFIKQQAEAFFHLRIFLLFDRQDRFKRLDHGPAVILFHPCGQGHQLRLDLHAPFRDLRDLLHL